jgi:hypothetical protein
MSWEAMILDHIEIDDLHKMVVELGGTVTPIDEGFSRIELGGFIEYTDSKHPSAKQAKRFVAAWVLAERINQMNKKASGK